MWKKLKSYFITGLLVLFPFVMTIFIIFWLFTTIYGNLQGNISKFLTKFGVYTFPGISLLIVFSVILLTGMMARNYLGKRIFALGDLIVTRIPLINRIYLAIQQISKAFLSEQREVFKNAVLIEYPRHGIYSVAFLTQNTGGEIQDKLQKDMLSVFVPTTPNPTSGYLLFIPRHDVIMLDMTIEEALKLVISGGVVRPNNTANGKRAIDSKLVTTPS
ncbi:DUF502 domain-containing protein [candidate division KSB1 bacterium]|nr:DUF502 domain-containing protein [candidate division KSB1 bacterium]